MKEEIEYCIDVYSGYLEVETKNLNSLIANDCEEAFIIGAMLVIERLKGTIEAYRRIGSRLA